MNPVLATAREQGRRQGKPRSLFSMSTLYHKVLHVISSGYTCQPPLFRLRCTTMRPTTCASSATRWRAADFTAVPGWGGVLMGVTALVTAAAAGPPADSPTWVAVWLADAGVAVALGLAAMVWKARRANVSLTGAAAADSRWPSCRRSWPGGADGRVRSRTPDHGCPDAGCCSTAPRSRAVARFRCVSCR